MTDKTMTLLASYLDDGGWHIEADNVRNGVDLESYENETRLIDWITRHLSQSAERREAQEKAEPVAEDRFEQYVATLIARAPDVQKLGERLAHLLDDDQFNGVEPILLGIAKELDQLRTTPPAERGEAVAIGYAKSTELASFNKAKAKPRGLSGGGIALFVGDVRNEMYDTPLYTAPPPAAGVPDGFNDKEALEGCLGWLEEQEQFVNVGPVEFDGVDSRIESSAGWLARMVRAMISGTPSPTIDVANVSFDSDGMCNEKHPERRCVCREEFGYRVCGNAPAIDATDSPG